MDHIAVGRMRCIEAESGSRKISYKVGATVLEKDDGPLTRSPAVELERNDWIKDIFSSKANRGRIDVECERKRSR